MSGQNEEKKNPMNVNHTMEITTILHNGKEKRNKNHIMKEEDEVYSEANKEKSCV